MRFLKKKITKGKAKKFINGSISILMSFLLTGVLSVSSMIVETIRFQQAKQQFEETTLASAVSILAYFDSDLAERFGLYGVDSASETVTTEMFLEYLQFNSDETEEGVYAANELSQLYDVSSGTYELKYGLTNYQVLKRQILEYEKYRAPINVAEDLLDVDKMLEKLKESALEAVPGLEKMLKICGSVADLVEAIKAIYGLSKDIQQLQLMINSGEEEGVFEYLDNKLFGEGWQLVEGLFTDEEWPSYDPSYARAFKNFKEAVNAKVTYMKENPAPPEPGPKPTADLASLESQYLSAKNLYENANTVLTILDRALTLGYCNSFGMVDSAATIEDIFDDEITEEILLNYGLSEESTRQALFLIINDEIVDILGEEHEIETFNTQNLESVYILLENEVDELEEDFVIKEESYLKAKSALDQWNQKNNAYTAYTASLAAYDADILAKRDTLVTVIENVTKQLNEYKGSLESATKALDSAAESLEEIEKANRNDNSEDSGDQTNIFTTVKNEYLVQEENKPLAGIDFLNTQREKLKNFDVLSINASYVFGNHFTTGKMLHNSEYYMTNTESIQFYTALAGLNLLEGMAEFVSLFTAMWDLVKIIQPFPSQFDLDCRVELNASTTDLLPSKINGGNGTFDITNNQDISDISQMLSEASPLVGLEYQQDINLVDPTLRLEQADITNQVSDAITRLADNFGKILGSAALQSMMAGVGGGALFFITAIMLLWEIIPILGEIIEDVILIANNIGTAIQVIIDSLGESLLLNQYAISMFPNRTTAKPVSGYSGASRTYFPDNSLSIQTFSSAQVEYLIGGSESEITNQQQCFWTIFAIRAINNAVAILADPDVVSAITSCNILAPLVYILWIYLESNVDTNLLVSRQKVPLIKYEIILSPTTIVENLESLERVFDDIDEEGDVNEEYSYAAMKIDYLTAELFKTDGVYEDMTYENYLWLFLFFVPNKTKVMRMADLIQMEMRYKRMDSTTSFELKNVYTYVRCESNATFNSILPVISLSGDKKDFNAFKLKGIKYVGY